MVIREQKNRKYIYMMVLLLAGIASFGIRFAGIEHITADFETCLIPWSAAMKAGQGPGILLEYDGDYNMPYITVLWLLNYLPGRTIVKVKMFSVLFEYLGAAAAGLITAHFAEIGKKRLMFTAACTVVMFYPSAILNGAWWGQCDFIYVAFLLYMILALLKEHYAAAMILLGCAFSFKLQAVLILPVLLIFWWKKRSFSGVYFLLAAVIMEVLCIPAILGGYSVFIPFSIYTRQLGRYPYMYVFYPNFWALFRDAPYYIFSNVAIFGILAGLGIFAVAVIRKKTWISERQWMEFALWTTFFMMCFLPCMHERYGMLVEILAILYAFLNRKTWWNAVVIGGGSLIAYLQVTFGQDILPDQWIAAAYLLCLGFLTWMMVRDWDRKVDAPLNTAADNIPNRDICENGSRKADPRNLSGHAASFGRKGGMTVIESRVMDFVDRYILILAILVLTVLAVVIRRPMAECISADYLPNLIEVEGNYHTPLYMFLMYLLSIVNAAFLPDKTLFFLVKVLCAAGDIFAAAMMAVCVRSQGAGDAAVPGKSERKVWDDRNLRAVVMYGAMLFLPMVLMNSPVWAHLDSISAGLLGAACLLRRRKKDILAGIAAGTACGLLAHYVVVLSFVLCLLPLADRKREGTAERQRQLKRFSSACGMTMIMSCLTGLLCGYNISQCIYKLFYFWQAPGTWMLYPLLILALTACFRDKRWIPVWVLMETAVILDWGEFLYEQPVLPHIIYILFYLAAGVLAAGILWRYFAERSGGRNITEMS